jgi:peptidoglycan/LPS O-acetylase OafA/YrhL
MQHTLLTASALSNKEATAIQRNHTIDVFRLLGAFCVVALHSPLGTMPNALALCIRLGSRWAVPFFFLVSGYFIANNLRDRQQINLSKSINSLIGIFIVANLAYCLFYLIDANPTTAIDLDFIKIIVGQSEHLWYIGSTVFGLLMLQYLASRYSDRTLFVVAAVTLLFVLSHSYASFTGIHMQQDVARYFTSIPFIFAGFLFGRHPEFLRRLSIPICIVISILGFLMESGEAIALYKLKGAGPHNQEMLLGTALLALGLFCLSLTFMTVQSNGLAQAGRSYSLLIYLYHPIIITIIYSILNLGKYNAYLYWISPIIDFTITLLVLKVIQLVSPTAFKVLSGA